MNKKTSILFLAIAAIVMLMGCAELEGVNQLSNNTTIPSKLVCGTTPIRSCSNDDAVVSCVISYKNGDASLSKVLACTQQYNLTHDAVDQKRLGALVACVNDYENKTKTLSQLLECIQTYNLSKTPTGSAGPEPIPPAVDPTTIDPKTIVKEIPNLPPIEPTETNPPVTPTCANDSIQCADGTIVTRNTTTCQFPECTTTSQNNPPNETIPDELLP